MLELQNITTLSGGKRKQIKGFYFEYNEDIV